MRRSLHFVPGGNEKMIRKALTLAADGLILDLEDAVTHVLCWMNFGGLPQDKIRRSMELFAKEVMPHFRDA